jgi:ABC-type antimicrobial peptide transport system permease subunit
MFYLPLLQTPDSPPRSIQVQSAGPPQLLASAIRQVVKEADPNIVITDGKTLVDQVDRTLGRERLLANLAGFFGGVALLLACIGLYSVMAYHVLQRTQEIGLPIALGSPRAKVLWIVSRDALLLSGLGLVFGVPLALSFSRFVESFLFGLTPTHPTTIGFVIVMLLSVAGLACISRRAARRGSIL